MKFIPQSISDVILIEPHVHDDERGYFLETFREDLLNEFLGYDVKFVQDNESKSAKGVLRGLHYQFSPKPQTKLVRVTYGCILDVAVDIRKSSPCFGQHVAVILNDANKHQLFIPPGFAHGFVVLSDEATVSYKVDNYFSRIYDKGIIYNDPELLIDWLLPIDLLKLSTKDKNQPTFSNNKSLFE